MGSVSVVYICHCDLENLREIKKNNEKLKTMKNNQKKKKSATILGTLAKEREKRTFSRPAFHVSYILKCIVSTVIILVWLMHHAII